jgi:O-Antigen ligase
MSAMRGRGLLGARVGLLAGPWALAFFAGGYFDEPRIWAGLGAWTLVALAAILSPAPLPRSRGALLAVGGLTLLSALTLVSVTWAPAAGSAWHDVQRLAMYLGFLLAGVALLRGRAVRALEPALAAGVLVIVAYGLSERLLPGLVRLSDSPNAGGRLEQPLTYWNAMGAMAALGLVLCARMMGDRGRPGAMRILAAAAAGPIGLGLFLSFSRGALFACAAGLIALLIAAPDRAQLRAVGLALLAGLVPSVVAAPMSGVASLTGASAARAREGAVMAAVLVGGAIAAALLQRWIGRHEQAGTLSARPLPLPRTAPILALLVVLAALGGFLAVGARETSRTTFGPGATRLQTLQSNRYQYWRVAARAFASEPLRGIGSSGFALYWLRHRPFSEGARDAHSLYIQTAAELGLIGLLLLAATIAGVVVAARQAHRRAPALAAGAIAGVTVWAAHVAVDWDWQLPAATLPAILMAGALLALADPDPSSGSGPQAGATS